MVEDLLKLHKYGLSLLMQFQILKHMLSSMVKQIKKAFTVTPDPATTVTAVAARFKTLMLSPAVNATDEAGGTVNVKDDPFMVIVRPASPRISV